jgi:hypothetical protein
MSAPEQPTAHGVRIDAQPGHAAISIDGTPVPQGQVTGYTLHHSIARELPTLVLHTRQPDSVLWEGLARVAVSVDKPASQTIVAFLAQVDPTELDRAALNRTDYGGHKGDTARAMLQTLAEWAREADL